MVRDSLGKPGDISASKRYYKEDIVEPEFLVNKDGTMDVPTKPGTCPAYPKGIYDRQVGVKVNMKILEKVTVKNIIYTGQSRNESLSEN